MYSAAYLATYNAMLSVSGSPSNLIGINPTLYNKPLFYCVIGQVFYPKLLFIFKYKVLRDVFCE